MRNHFRPSSTAGCAALAAASLLALACGASQDATNEPATPAAAEPAAAEPAAAATPADPSASQDQGQSAPAKGADQVTSFHQLSAKTIEGKEQPFTAYEGKVVLAVNTASQCGFTPQYAGLEKLSKKYEGKGLVVLGFPSNDFGGQEPGTDKEVQTFCQVRYGVTFPLFSKSVVKGEGASPVFHFLAAGGGGEPQWNFHKYLVDKHGKVIAGFGSKTTPDDPALTAAIDKALADK